MRYGCTAELTIGALLCLTLTGCSNIGCRGGSHPRIELKTISEAVSRLHDTQEFTGSIPVGTTASYCDS